MKAVPYPTKNNHPSSDNLEKLPIISAIIREIISTALFIDAV
jgi:hypothetical protein